MKTKKYKGSNYLKYCTGRLQELPNLEETIYQYTSGPN